MLSLESISSEVLKTILASGAEALSSRVLARFQKSREASKELRDYIQRVTNRVAYFIAYRPQPQHIDEAYVQPLVLDSALSQTYIPPYTYEKIVSALTEGLSQGLSGDNLSRFINSRVPRSDDLVLSVKYIPLDELSSNYHSTIVLGEAGAGKSALLSYLCLTRLRSNRPRLPIFADARDIGNQQIQKLIDDVLETLQLSDKNLKWLDKTLSVYIDGLDELDSKRFKEVCVELGILRRELPGLEITVSCRSAAYHGELSFLTEVSLVPFDFIRAKEFIYRWFKSIHEAPLPDRLVAQLQKSERLSELSSQPLLLALMCNAYRRYLTISRRHTALFDQCLESLLWQWDADRLIARNTAFSNLDIEKKKWLHAILAVNLHVQRKRFSEKRFLLSILHEALPVFGISYSRASEVLEELCSHHGILVKWTEETYGFGHLALQEYLASKWYADEQRWRTLMTREVLTDSWWENTISMCLATLSDATNAMTMILDHTGLTELEKLRLLANSLKYDPLVSPDVRSAILQRVLHLYHNGNATEHDAAVDMLVGIDDEWTAPVIIKSLDSKLPTRELAKILKRSGEISKNI